MINIITNKKCIKDFEAFFESNVLSTDFTSSDTEVLFKIDNAYLIDKEVGSVKTKFGITDLPHLSTGCMVVLSYLYIQRNKEKEHMLAI